MATVLNGTMVRPTTTTFGGEPINNITKGLPKTVQSICPEPGCARVIPARLYAEDGKVYMEKSCPEHGPVKDLYWSDVEMYLKAERWEFGDYVGVSNPKSSAGQCPRDCGLCASHTNHTVLGNIDLTNRCNLNCPICFANANKAGRIYEPTKDEILAMLDLYRAERPVPACAVQFSGGEPTVHPDFFDIVRAARDKGFALIQMASNGIKLADPDFARRTADAGLHTVYLQFDGFDDDIYMQTRGRRLLDLKMKAVESIRQAGMKIVYVPTIVRGLNDHQVGDIVRFAVENIDISTGISFQPVSCTGRISYAERERMRYTLPDLTRDIDTQTGITVKDDWYPLSLVSPISKMMSAVRGTESIHIACHPHCSLATFLAVEPGTKRPVALTRFVDIEGLFTELDRQAIKTGEARFKRLAQASAVFHLSKYYRADQAPKGLDFMSFLHSLDGMMDRKIGRNPAEHTYKMLLVAGMHFMDGYNYEVERVRRCVIHYATPDGRIIPFCSYNTAHTHRNVVEERYSMSIDEYRQRQGGKVEADTLPVLGG